MKKILIAVLNTLGIVMLIMTILIFMDLFSKDFLETVRLVIMSFYVYTALLVPWVLKAGKKTKLISLLCMVLYPMGIFNLQWFYVTAAVVFFSVYLFISHNFLEEVTS